MKLHKFIYLFLIASLSTLGSAAVLKGKPVEGVTKISLPPLKGPKKLIAVESFENKVENPHSYWYRNTKLGDGMSDMLVTALMKTDYFIVLEREKVKKVLAEQDLAASGRTTKVGGAKMAKILRSQVLISGAVTLFSEGTKKGNKKGGFSFRGVSIGLGGGGGESQVGIDMRLYDTTTSQILAAQTCKGFAKSKGKAFSLGLSGTSGGRPGAVSFGGGKFEKSPLGDATRSAINSAVVFVAKEMNKIPWSGKVMKVSQDGKIYINAGKRNNVLTGATFNVYELGEGFIDPDTGEDLGSEETLLGQVQIVQLKQKFAICTKVSGANFSKNNVIRWSDGA